MSLNCFGVPIFILCCQDFSLPLSLLGMQIFSFMQIRLAIDIVCLLLQPLLPLFCPPLAVAHAPASPPDKLPAL